jgi:uncharacterized protein with HEPN domain
MRQPDDAVFLRHILDPVEKVSRYLVDVDEETFLGDTLIQDGVIRQIQIMGEAVRRVSPSLRNRYPSVPWHNIARMRSKLVHDYFGVDLLIIYDTAINDLPPLRTHVQAVLQDLETKSS